MLKRLGAQPGEGMKTIFSLPEHEGFTEKEIANDLAKYFANISQEYTPLEEKSLPERVIQKLNFRETYIPMVEEYQVYEKIKEMNIPDSTVPGDFPPRIWKNFGAELALPVSKIANKILKTGKWPNSWKMEYVSVIEKEKDPKTKDELRNISLTLFISKLVENLIYDLLIKVFGDKIDSGQHGGRKKYIS